MQRTESWQFIERDRIAIVQPQGRFKADSATALACSGIAWLPDCITHPYVISGALVPIMTRYPVPPAGRVCRTPAEPASHSQSSTVLG